MTTRFVTSGVNGANGVDGSDGSYGGGDGTDGTRGRDGTSAKNITTRYAVKGSSIVITGTHSATLALGNRSNGVFMEATGGHGGKGGNGGDGGTGRRGHDGADATRYSSGGNGGDGGPGGDGGDGKDGGHAGDGAFIRVSMAAADLDLAMLPTGVPATRGGTGGKAGKGGARGAGGAGGSGGASYSWTESTTTYNSATNTNTTTYTTYSNPGGCSGCTGPSGAPGRDGRAGNNGRNGGFEFLVDWGGAQGETSYPWRYDLAVRDSRLYDTTNDDGVFEPGEKCRNEYNVLNSGKMPTPPVQDIKCSLTNNQWVKNSSTTVAAQKKVSVGQKTAAQGGITFDIPRVAEPKPDTCFTGAGRLEYSAWVDRVNLNFKELGKPGEFLVQYPVRISAVHGAVALSRTEVGPLLLCLHNNSTKSTLGHKHNRAVSMRIQAVKSLQCMTNIDNRGFCQLSDANERDIVQADVDVQSIGPSCNNYQSNAFFQWGPNPPEYSHCTVVCSLMLADVHSGAPARIQRRSVQVQLSEYYAHNPSANICLVTNHRTNVDGVGAWKKFAAGLGTEISPWNATMHDGLSLHAEVGGGSLADHFRSSSLIVQNNDPQFLMMLASKRNVNNESAMDTLPTKELVGTMRTQHLGFCVLGQPCNARKRLMPIGMPQAGPTRPVFREKSVSMSEFIRIALEVWRELAIRNPTWRFVVAYDYINRTMGPKKVLVGELSIFRSVDRTGARMCQLSMTDAAVNDPKHIKSDAVLYSYLKSLPFHTKLALAQNRFIDKEQLQKAILSDLCEEQRSLRRYRWCHGLDFMKHVPVLTHLIQSPITLSEPAIFTTVLIRYYVLLERWFHWHDYLMVNRRWRVLSTVCTKAIDPLLHKLGIRPLLIKEKLRVVKMSLQELINEHTGTPRAEDNTPLERCVISLSELQLLEQQDVAPAVVTSRWAMRSARERKVNLYKLSTQFCGTGDLPKSDSRQNQGRTNQHVWHCLNQHNLVDVTEQGKCVICDETARIVRRCGSGCPPETSRICANCIAAGTVY